MFIKDKMQEDPPTKVEDDYEEFVEVEAIDQKGYVDHTLPEDDQPKCRFCWMDVQDEKNPLFGACACQGSVRFIHFECLKNWLDVKKSQKILSNFSSFYWKAFECEICKRAYPLMMKSKGK